ncbi:MAG TPA: isoprenylcysteine carboxylmethyltransferase family protein [Flavobacterium lutivivi]|nr:isoprenylcysteine carboxylmethyltransferase family protein [Flavobacterium lutivivi]
MRIRLKDKVLVSIQFVLFGCYAIDFDWSLGFSLFFKFIGLTFSIIGLIISLLAVLQLNKNLSPFPTPKEDAILLENGLYKFVRHPIYSGLLLLFYGYGIYIDSIYKLLISSLLLVLFYFKTNYEERLLEIKFQDYSLYKKKVGRFFPKIK